MAKTLAMKQGGTGGNFYLYVLATQTPQHFDFGFKAKHLMFYVASGSARHCMVLELNDSGSSYIAGNEDNRKTFLPVLNNTGFDVKIPWTGSYDCYIIATAE